MTVGMLGGYQERLRVIGRELDQDWHRTVTILEEEDGFDVATTAAFGGERRRQRLTNADIAAIGRRTVARRGEGERPTRNPLLPTGYEDFLRALGYALDQRGAAAVIVRVEEALVTVSGRARDDGGFAQRLDRAEIAGLVDAAVRRRLPAPEAGRRRLFGTLTPPPGR